MKSSLLFSLVTVATFQLSAQQEVHLSVNSGIGKIGYKLYDGERANAVRMDDRYSATFGINLSYTYQFGDFSIESGVSYNDLKANQNDGFNMTETLVDGSTRVIKRDIVTERKARYLTVPLKLNYKIDKLQIGAGIYLSSLISNKYYAVEYTDDVYSGANVDGNSLNNLDFGLSAQAEYALSDRASILFSTNLGLMNISTNNSHGGQFMVEQINPVQRELRNTQIMLGLKFRLFKS